MGDTRRYDNYNNEKKLHKVRQIKNRFDKHKKLIYNAVSSKINGDAYFDDQFNYGGYEKFKRR